MEITFLLVFLSVCLSARCMCIISGHKAALIITCVPFKCVYRVATPNKPEVDTHRTASPIKREVQQIRENTPDIPVKTSARQSRPRERQDYQNPGVNDR